jgi:hypothetical protein
MIKKITILITMLFLISLLSCDDESTTITITGSNNANLNGLTVSIGSLSPIFDTDTTTYNITVSNLITSTTVTATMDDLNASILIEDTNVDSGQTSNPIALAIGNTNIEVEVMAENGTIKTYTIIVTRFANSNANLNNLTISGTTLSPTFSSDTTLYFARYTQSSGVTSTTVTPTVENEEATVKVNDTNVTSGEESQNILLNDGTNNITVLVTAEDSSEKIYTIKICKTVMDLYKSGQTISYATGDDGDLEIGKTWPSPRFTVNGDSTITDNLTGLIWSSQGSVNLYTWSEALSTATNDWRIPNIHEMRSLFNYGYNGNLVTYLDINFDYIYGAEYWTSTTSSTNTSQAWTFCLDKSLNHRNSAKFKYNSLYSIKVKSSSMYIRKTGQTTCYKNFDNYETIIACIEDDQTNPAYCQDAVRNQGVEWPSPRFTDNNNDTITDNLTGLMWQKAPDSTLRNWTNALAYADDSILAGFSDWRLPNVIELQTLTDANNSYPAIPTEHLFTNVQNIGYWTSTTSSANTDNAFMVSIATGYDVLDDNKTTIAGTWIVR